VREIVGSSILLQKLLFKETFPATTGTVGGVEETMARAKVASAGLQAGKGGADGTCASESPKLKRAPF
jgi:hypothetical protein